MKRLQSFVELSASPFTEDAGYVTTPLRCESRHDSRQTVASIVVPAHNEEKVIARCLDAIFDTARPGEFEVIVACNGCTDRTAAIASQYHDVRVIETDQSSKIAALNMGDETARCFPRFYVDADVLVTTESIRNTINVMYGQGLLAASPSVRWDLRQCNRWVRAFYRVWRYQPYFDRGQLGAGLYSLSREGHARIGSFPDITADDEFIRQSFAPDERGTARDAVFTVLPPRRLRDLIRIKTRSRRGNWELRRVLPAKRCAGKSSKMKFAWRIVTRPALWPSLPIYTYVVAATWFGAWKTTYVTSQPRWERDLSTR